MAGILDINWFVLIVNPEGKLFQDMHIVGYSEEPTAYDLKELIDELKTDDEFEFAEKVYLTDYFFKVLHSNDPRLGTYMNAA